MIIIIIVRIKTINRNRQKSELDEEHIVVTRLTKKVNFGDMYVM